MKAVYNFLLFLFISTNCFGQISLFKNSTYSINREATIADFNLLDTVKFIKANEQILLPKFSTLWLKFHIEAKSNQDSTVFIFCDNQGYVKLFEINDKASPQPSPKEREFNDLKLVGETGFTCPYHLRSIRGEISFIKLKLQKGKSQDFLLEVKNFAIEHNNLVLKLYDYAHFQELKNSKNDTFVNKYGQPIFLGIVALILLITLIQCVIFREKIYFIYLLYIIFTLLRVAMGISLLVVEDYFPALNGIGFISRFSQTFAFLSIITYLFFIREFAHIPQKAPKLNKIIGFQVFFTVIFLVFELFVVVEKYTVPLYIGIFNSFELLEAIFVVIIIFGLFGLYDKQNKFLIFGVVTFFIGSFVGQQILVRFSNLSRLELENYLQILWGIAYLGEMTFFTLGLFDRAAIMKKTIETQSLENQKLMQELTQSRNNDSGFQPDTLNIATNKGTIIIQQDDIFRIEASGSYTVFYVQKQKQVMASNTLSDFEDKLNTDRFLRVHKSHIINLQYIVKYTKGDGGSLTMQDGSEIPVSRSRKDELMKKLLLEP